MSFPSTLVPQLVAMGNERLAAGDQANARELFLGAVNADNGCAAAYHNLAIALLNASKYKAAVPILERVVRLDPNNFGAWSSLGGAYWRLQDFRKAQQALDEANRLSPNDFVVLNRLGLLAYSRDWGAESERYMRQALDLKPDLLGLRNDYAHAVLKSGDLARGLEFLEVRWEDERQLKKNAIWQTGLPQWKGEKSKVLLLHHEQGFGDTIQFCRFIPAIAQAAGYPYVIFAAPAPLHRLLQGQCAIDEIISDGDAGAIVKAAMRADFHCPLMSAAAVLRPEYFLGQPRGEIEAINEPTGIGYAVTRRANVGIAYGGEGGPVVLPDAYLTPPAGQLRDLKPGGAKLTVGICWGASAVERGQQKSCKVEEMLDLGSVPGVALWSLQFGPRADDLAITGADCLVAAVPGGIGDFADTAAIIRDLDVVVSVDTSIAHLAGALGKKTFLLNQVESCWRWIHGPAPWYRSMTMVRQVDPDTWAEPIAVVKDHLELMVGARDGRGAAE